MTNTTQFDEHIAYLTSPKRSKMQQQQPIDDSWQLDTDGNEIDDFHDDDCYTKSNDMPTTTLSKQRKKIVVGVLVVSIVAIILGAICIGMFMKDSNHDEKQQSNNIDSLEMEGASDGIGIVPTPSPMIDTDDASSLSSFFFANNDTSTVTSDSPTLNPSQLSISESPTDVPSQHPITDTPSLQPVTSNPTEKPTTKSPSSPPTPSKVYDAVVVGSGWSGLRAAQVLADSRLSVLILEANDYIGGRAKTINTMPNNIPTDIGCEWLYTEYSSMVSDLDDVGLITNSLENDENMAPLLGNDLYYTQTVLEDGTKIAVLLEDGQKIQSNLWSEFLSFKKDLLKALGDVSYADAVTTFLEENDMSYTNDEEQMFNLLLEISEAEYAGDSDMMSMNEMYYGEGGCAAEALYMAVPNVGFGNTAASFAETIDADIKLNSKVTSINYEDDDQVMITYEEDGIVKTVGAQTVLVTVSLGVLKAKTISFTPQLPYSKQDAIDNMGFGLLNKATLYWDKEEAAVWPQDTSWFELITPEDESSGLWTTFYNAKAKGVPCLIGWIGGDEAVEMEEQSDEEILEQVMINLRSMWPTITQPDNVFISRWGQEENVLGSYSFNKVGRTYSEDASNLREPIGNKAWFAGEATNTDEWHATSVGAWDSGEQVGQDMVSVLKRRRFI